MLTPLDKRFRADLDALAAAARTRGKQLPAKEVTDLVKRIRDAYHEVTFTFSHGED